MGALLNGLIKSDIIQNEISLLCRDRQRYVIKVGLDPGKSLKSSKELSRRIKRCLKQDKYIHADVKRSSIKDGKKQRIIYSLSFTDRVVNGGAHKIIAPKLDGHIIDSVYSYRKGRSRLGAIKKLNSYINDYKAAVPDVKQRALFVMRSDIKSYGESIPVHENSALWKQIRAIFADDIYQLGFDARDYALLKQLVRPQIKGEGDLPYTNLWGIIDGSPLSAILLNLYLRPLDEYLSSVPASFYARYGDDIIFVTHDRHLLQCAEEKVTEILSKLELRLNLAKKSINCLNGAGKTIDGIYGLQKLEFLGLSVSFNNVIELKKDKFSELLRAARRRIESIDNSLVYADIRDLEQKGRIICESLNAALNPKAALALSEIHSLGAINSKSQLKYADYLLALCIAEKLTKTRGVKSFRQVSYRKIRGEWNLHSLAYLYRKQLNA